MPGQGEINASVQRRNLERPTSACSPVFRLDPICSDLISNWLTCKSIRLDRGRQTFRFRSRICFRCGTLLGSRSGNLLSTVCHQLYFFKSAAIVANCESAASKSSTISCAITSGSGRLALSSRLSSLSQKMSRLSLSRLVRASEVKLLKRSDS